MRWDSLLSRWLQCGSVTSLGMLSLGLLQSVTAVDVTEKGTGQCDGVWMMAMLRWRLQQVVVLANLSGGGSMGSTGCDEKRV